jgi:hypothetical protein
MHQALCTRVSTPCTSGEDQPSSSPHPTHLHVRQRVALAAAPQARARRGRVRAGALEGGAAQAKLRQGRQVPRGDGAAGAGGGRCGAEPRMLERLFVRRGGLLSAKTGLTG